jgi:hypothetical protein
MWEFVVTTTVEASGALPFPECVEEVHYRTTVDRVDDGDYDTSYASSFLFPSLRLFFSFSTSLPFSLYQLF